MIDDAYLKNDPALRHRWEAVLAKLEEASESLLTQGGLVPKATGSGGVAWSIRWVDREAGSRPVHRAIGLGGDVRLVELARRQLAYYKTLGRLAGEISAHARIAATASFSARCLAAGRPRRKHSRA